METSASSQEMQALLSRLEEIYRRYLEESEALFRNGTGFLHAIRSVLGTNTIKTSAIHQKFFDSVSDCVSQLVQKLEQQPDPLIAEQATRLLLENRPKGKDLTRYGWLSAAQILVIPLLPFVSRQELECQYSAYCTAHPKRDRLPKQVELVETMEQLLGYRGKAIRRRG